MKTNHTSLIKYSVSILLSVFTSLAHGTDRPPPYSQSNSTVLGTGARLGSQGLQTGLSTGGRTAGDSTAAPASPGDADQAAANDQVNGGPAAVGANVGVNISDLVHRSWINVMRANPSSSTPRPAGSMRGQPPPRTVEDYQSTLPREPGTVQRAGAPYTPPTGGCGDYNQLTFAGISFIGNAICVAASNDSEASRACAGRGRYVNPNNPQYGINPSGNRTQNPQGYYYCVADDPRNNKEAMCTNLAPLRFPGMEFRWVSTGDGDGNCTCAVSGQLTSASMCNDPQQMAAAAARTAERVACQGENVQSGAPVTANQIQNRTAEQRDGLYCRCTNSAPQALRGTYVTAPGGDSCSAPASTQAGGPPAPAPGDFNRCLADYRQKAMDCTSQAEQAQNTCREKMEKAQNSPLNIAGGMVGALGQVGMAANANTGNQQNCFGAGVGMMGVREALRLGRESCEAEFGTCQRTCAQENYDRMLTECPAKLRDPQTGQPMTQAQLIQLGDENARNFEAARSEFQRTFADGRRVCQERAGGAAQDMNRLMSGLGNSIQQSMRCACNVSSGSQNANCNQIPSIQTCETNPGTPGCELYSGVDSCNPSSIGYNQQMCNCAQNPTTCTTVSGTPPPSMFGGNLANAPAPSGGNGFAGNLGAGGGGRGGYAADVGEGGEAQAALARPEFGRGGGGGAAGGLGGMGGGAGGGSGGPSGDGAPKVEAEGKGLAGLFNQAKMALGSAFGFGKGGAAGKTTASGKPGSKDDLTKFKPRNLASTGRNGIGTANMDIFGMIKMCAQGETCETNRPKSAWILTP